MMNPIWDPSDVIDPVVDRVWMVEVTMDSTMFVVAADEHEAKDLAGRHWRDEEIEPVSFYATETDKVYGEEARLIAWGRSFYKGKQLYIGDVLALIERKRPHYDTETILMPWVDSPPPFWLEDEE